MYIANPRTKPAISTNKSDFSYKCDKCGRFMSYREWVYHKAPDNYIIAMCRRCYNRHVHI